MSGQGLAWCNHLNNYDGNTYLSLKLTSRSEILREVGFKLNRMNDQVAAGPLRETELLLQSLVPSSRSNRRRRDIMGFIENVLRQGSGQVSNLKLLGSGSFFSRTYLPASDIDLVLSTNDNIMNEMEHILSVFQALCTEVSLRDSGNSVLSSVQSPMTIRNVEFINARTKLCHCLVNNVGVDVTINSVGALTTVLFIEEADRYLAKDHIFKKSLLLVKCWALNDSTACVGQSILGSKTGMLSSYALCVLVLRLFDQYPDLSHPLAVLTCFFHTYADADWENVVMTVQGPKQLTHSQRASGSIMLDVNDVAMPSRSGGAKGAKDSLLGLFVDYFSREVNTLYNQVEESTGVDVRKLNANSMTKRGLALRSCNIQDPVDANNNLGYSVTRDNLELLQKAFVMGRNHLQHLLRLHYCDSTLNGEELALRINEEATSPTLRLAANKENAPLDLPFVKAAFPMSFREYFLSLGTRVDMLDHPMQTWRPAHGPSIVDSQLGTPLGDQERGYVQGLHAAVLERTSRKRSGSGNNEDEDPLLGELRDMWSALKMELLRQGAPAEVKAEGSSASVDAQIPADAHTKNSLPAKSTIIPVSRGQSPEVKEKSSMFVGDESKTATQPVCVSSVEGNEDVLQTQQQHQNLSLSFNSSHASVSGESEADNEAMSPASGCASASQQSHPVDSEYQ